MTSSIQRVALVLTVAAAAFGVPQGTAQEKKDKPTAGTLKFEIYQDKAKEYRWRLKAPNGAILATAGEGYKAKADCRKGVDRIKADAGTDKLTFEVYEDKAKEYRWRLKAPNGQVIAASSEGYKARADCEKAIDTIKKGAAKAAVEDLT
jgi:uncharacterized protein YegP (UPF0339 family)